MFQTRKSFSLEKHSISIKSTEDALYCSKTSNSTNSTNEINKAKHPGKHNPFLGLFYAFLACTTFTLSTVMVKMLWYINPGQLSLVRNAGVFAGSLPVAVYCNREILGAKKDRMILVVRGFLGATALYLNLTAYRYLPLAEGAIIIACIPALTTLMAYFYLKESCGRMQSLCLVITICGALISIRLPELLSEGGITRFDSSYLGGLAAAVGCVFVMGFTFVSLRQMKDIHFSVITLYTGFIGMIENAAINAVSSTFVSPTCGWDQTMVGLIAALGFFTNITFTLSVQAEAAGIMSIVITSLDIIIAIVFQIIFFGENPDIYNIAGTVLVLTSLSIIGTRKWLLTLPEESEARKKLKYLLL